MLFSATVPPFIQNIARESMENPVLIDLVGDNESQLPSTLRSKAILTDSFENKIAHLKKYITENKNKKILIFCETKRDVEAIGTHDFAKFTMIHGDFG